MEKLKSIVGLREEMVNDKLRFILNYRSGKNAASSSLVDPNANVSQKNICTLQTELFKDFAVQINNKMMYYKIGEMFGYDLAEEYIEQLMNHEIYKHDNSALQPYTYGPHESIIVVIDEKERLTTFESLYELCDSKEICEDPVKGVWCKYPNNMKIFDKNGLTNISRLVKKTRHRDLLRLKLKYGEDIIVTDNHPMITGKGVDDTTPAVESLGMEQQRFFNTFNSDNGFIDSSEIYPCECYGSYNLLDKNAGTTIEGVHPKIKLTDQFGYFIGMFIAEGHYTPTGVVITQNDKELLKKIASSVFVSTGVVGKIYKESGKDKHTLAFNSLFLKYLLHKYFNIKEYAKNKNLPENILQTNACFVEGLICGIIDGDGTVSKNISIRLSSRSVISGLSVLLKMFGFGVSNIYQEPPEQAFGSFSSNHPLFGISFGLTGEFSLKGSYKVENGRENITTKTYYDFGNGRINKIDKIENPKYLDNFIYDITTDSKEFLCNNIRVHNCVSITMYPFLLNGTKPLGGNSEAPKHFKSFCGGFLNLVFEIAAQFAGAVATTEFLMYADYFARKDYGYNYLETNTKEILEGFDTVVYGLNEPAAARNYQAVFWNISIFDKDYFNALFGDFAFPDGIKPEYESVHKLQMFFMDYFSKERERKLLTFPVITQASLYHDNGEPYDSEFHDFIAEQLSKGHSFFNYQSDSPDTLSSCCFHGDQKFISNKGVRSFSSFNIGDSIKVPTHTGEWKNAKVYKYGVQELFEVSLVKGRMQEKILCTKDHKWFLDSGKTTNTLSIGDKILKTPNIFDFSWDLLSKEQKKMWCRGFALGDGIERKKNKGLPNEAIEIRLCGDKTKFSDRFIECGYSVNSRKDGLDDLWVYMPQTHKVIPEDDLDETTYNVFVDGLLCADGWYNKCSKSNVFRAIQLTGSVNDYIYDLLVRAGQFVSSTKDLSDQITNYGRRTGRTIYYQIQANQTQGCWTVKDIQKTNKIDDVWCLEVEDNESFLLDKGIVTGNCRLSNKIVDKPVFSYSLGAGGVATGSIAVITLNMNRLEQDKHRTLENEITKIHKYHAAYRSLMQDNLNSGLLPVYDAGFINMDKQFSTIGFLGLPEAAEYRGVEVSYNKEYISFCSDRLKIIYEMNRKAKEKYGFLVNTEAIPGESVGVKFAKWDREDGYESPRDCYNSYFYLPEDVNCLPMDKFKLHGKEVIQYLDGGSALHYNLDDFPTKDGYKDLLKYAAQCGCSYWCTNIPSTCCNDCGFINKYNTKECTKCGSKDVDYATRIIGYLKKIKDFSEDRQKEASKRIYH